VLQIQGILAKRKDLIARNQESARSAMGSSACAVRRCGRRFHPRWEERCIRRSWMWLVQSRNCPWIEKFH